ncbi:MAG: STAS domain-containing protein [Candidatus Sericytochromatia bacterium]|nr:STAS domain-containing protein [Candidatus Sericytochromatia bacterium]
MSNAFRVVVRKDPQGRFAVLATDGYVNHLAGEQLGEAANLLLAEGYTRLVINLEQSTVASSTGVSCLAAVVERVHEGHGSLAFCHLTRTLQKTFAIMGLSRHRALYETEEEAVRGLLADG